MKNEFVSAFCHFFSFTSSLFAPPPPPPPPPNNRGLCSVYRSAAGGQSHGGPGGLASDEPLDYANNAHWLLPSSSSSSSSTSGCSSRADGSALVSDAKSPSLTSSSGPLYSLYETSATRSVQNQHQQQQQQQQQQQEEEEDVDRGGHGSDHVAYYDAASLYPSSGEQLVDLFFYTSSHHQKQRAKQQNSKQQTMY